MSKTFEDRLRALSQEDQDGFHAACTSIFQMPSGRRVLATLVQLVHPLESPLSSSPESTAANVGRAEIVAALWRRSDGIITPRNIPTTQP